MARFLEHEKASIVARFLEKVGEFDANQLEQVVKGFSREMTSGKMVIDADQNTNFRVWGALNRRLKELRALEEDSQLPSDPEERLKAEAQRLAKQHGVSIKTAENYLRRERGDAVAASDAAAHAERLAKEHGVSVKTAENYLTRKQRQEPMRKDIKPAPDPEPAMPEPSAEDKWVEKWGRK